MPSSEVSRLGRLWLESHGDDDVALAREMIAELEESGNDADADMWRRIIMRSTSCAKPSANRTDADYRYILT